MTLILLGVWLVGTAICIPLFFDRDDPWGIAFALMWPLLVLAALGVTVVGVAQRAWAAASGESLPQDEDRL